MSVNSSFTDDCYTSTAGRFSSLALIISSFVLIFPLCVLVLYVGDQRWRRQRCSRATVSHSDVFTYHMVTIELLTMAGSVVICWGFFAEALLMVLAGSFLLHFKFIAQMFYHLLTCVDRYLAVVHPITYRNLRQEKVVLIRNVSAGSVWLLSLGLVGIMCIIETASIVILCSGAAFTVIGVSSCSLSALCVLIRPQPGEGDRARPKIAQSKLRAFRIILVMLGTLLFMLCGNLLAIALIASPQLSDAERFGAWLSILWFSVPGDLVLPLLFLERAGKLPLWRIRCKSGQRSD